MKLSMSSFVSIGTPGELVALLYGSRAQLVSANARRMGQATSGALDLHQSFPGEAASGRRGSQPPAGGLAVAHVHLLADLPHDVDDLVHRDLELHAGHGQLDTRERDGRASG